MPIHVSPLGDPNLFSGPEAVNFFRMTTLLRGMKFELKTGMRMTGKAPSCFTIVRKEYGFKGNKQKLIDQFEKVVEEENKKMQYVREG